MKDGKEVGQPMEARRDVERIVSEDADHVTM